ncbi:hypothetical protein ACKWTF_013440 [Chironomus riparius]
MVENKEIFNFDIGISALFNILNIYCIPFIFQFACPVVAIRDRFCLVFQKKHTKMIEIYMTLEIYEKLFECIDLINNNLTFPLIHMFGFLLVSIIFEIHNFILVFHLQAHVNFLILSPNVLWMFLCLHLWIVVIYSSVSTMTSFNKINSIEYQILKDMKSLEPNTFRFIKAYLTHIRGIRKSFETLFFDIDWRLLFGCISTATTYIIVTAQMDKSLYEAPSNATATLF